MKRDWTSQTAILLIGLIVVVVNLVALNVFARFDLTDDEVYSLSEASIDLVRGLEDPVTVTAYFTADLPAPYSANRRYLRDKLNDYRAYAGDRLQYEFVDPAGSDELRTEARRAGIPPVQIQVVESDNVQLKNAYMGLAIQYGGEREVIPVVQDLSTLEYDITSAIRSLTREELPTVGLLTGHGEPRQQEMQTLVEELRRNYDVESVSVEDTVLAPHPDALLVIAPSDTLPPAHARALDRYVMEGGRLGLLLNRVDANLQMGQASVLNVGLDSLLQAYGIHIQPNLVMDRQSSAVTIQQRQGVFNLARQIEYPFLPVASNVNPNNLMVSRLQDVMFYFVSSMDTSRALPAGVEWEPLVYSSRRSATQQGFFRIQPQLQQQQDFSDGPFVLAAAYRGTFPSAFASERASVPTRIVAVGDGDFLNESIVGRIPGNLQFGLNIVDWLVQDDALLAIRSKSVEPRPLDEVSDGLRPWIKYGNMIGPVLLVMAFGLMQWRRRKQQEVLLAP